MKRSVWTGTVVLSVVMAALAAPTAGASAPRDPALAPLTTGDGASAIAGSYIVVLKDAASTDAAADRARDAGAQVTREFHQVRGYAAELSAAELAEVRRDPAVAFVEQDQVVSVDTTQNNPPWGLDRIDQANLPLNAQYNYTPTGLGVDAYIIDTGLRATHTQFTGRTAAGFSAITDRDGSPTTTDDCHGHGTHVAGTVGGTTYGVAKQVRLIPVRVLDCSGNGTDSGVIAGMDWAIGHDAADGGPAVANMSLGGGASAAMDAAVVRMTNAGITVVVAAGNDNANACNSSPARAPSAITTGSTTSTDARSSFSNWGTCLDLFAPGSGILSAWYTSNSASATLDGTSMASPHVAGVAALYLQGNPTASPSTVASAITTNATPNKVTSPGTGSPNLLLYSPLTGSPPPPPTPPNVTLDPTNQTVAAGANATFTSAATGSPTPMVQWQVDTGTGFSNLAGATNTTLTLTNVTVGMNGYDYRAVFTNTGGSDTSAAANLAVTTTPPNVTLDPTNQTAAAGANATFTSAATGNPTPTVQWQVDTGSGFTNLAGATSTTLTLTGVTVGMNGYDYRAVFTNTAGSDTSAAANLTVTAPPPNTDCDETVTGSVDSRSSTIATSFTLAAAGRLTGCLTGPGGTNFDLFLERFDGRSWVGVTSGQGSTSTENVTVASAAAGSYRWIVVAASGSGSYTLKFGRP